MLPPASQLATAAGALVQAGRPTVVYSANAFTASARCWWTLRTLGMTDVYVLDGGLSGWKAAGGGTESGGGCDRNEHAPGIESQPAARASLLLSLQDVLHRIDDPSAVIIDARPEARFRGRAPEVRPGLRSGHMPRAVNVPSDVVFAADGTLKGREDLAHVFEKHGLSVRRLAQSDVSVSCGSGVTAAIVLLALHELGIQAALYDGSWAEYGDCNRSHPVVTD